MTAREYSFHELGQAPSGPGIYAWYHKLRLSIHDVDTCAKRIAAAQVEERVVIARDFLEKFVFSHYAEASYDVRVAGRLKPTYEGQISHIQPISESLTARIAEDPERLHAIREVLQETTPSFASPIYIGVAANLRQRLKTHKMFIERYSQARAEVELTEYEADEESSIAHSFAAEVCHQRRFASFNLYAHVFECEINPEIRIDLENILNRINYPLCGRN
jgi:predicted GIY-YIG superfamily endonuclease